jgi:creatinine amidohydrolase
MADSILDETMAVMSWPEIEDYGRAGTVVLWTLSVLEEHGPHLPIGVDIYYGCILGRKIKAYLSQSGISSLIAPSYYWGINNVTAAFPGSFSVRPGTLKAMLYDTLACLERWGFECVFIFESHGDVNHRRAVLDGIAEARMGCGTRAIGIIPYQYAKYANFTGKEEHVIILPPDANPISITDFTPHQDIHAGSLETSLIQRYYPEYVNVEKAQALRPTTFEPEDWKKWASGWTDARSVVPQGYNGDPAVLKPELAEAFLDEEARSIARLITSYLHETYQAPVIE